MLLWGTPVDYSQVISLTLACPKSANPDDMTAEAHWFRDIPHPAASPNADMFEPSADAPAEDIDLATWIDLEEGIAE